MADFTKHSLRVYKKIRRYVNRIDLSAQPSVDIIPGRESGFDGAYVDVYRFADDSALHRRFYFKVKPNWTEFEQVIDLLIDVLESEQ